MSYYFLMGFKIFLILWPLLVTTLAFLYYKKQNGEKPLTGGPISLPKSFWLAYTVSTWFFFPLLLVFNSEVETGLKVCLVFHLLSWWIRGPLELIMIYKWFNWTPRYGIGHDFFHISGLILFFFYFHTSAPLSFANLITTIFILITIFATIAEIVFAFLFLRFRTKEEEQEHIYFASDDPKWIFINRITKGVVTVVMGHLLWQAFFTMASF